MELNLFEDVIAENEKYINVLDALNLVSKKIKYSVSDVARRLLIDKFQQVACMYRENQFNQIELYCSERNFDGNYVESTDFLNFAIISNGTFNFTETDNFGHEHEHTISEWFNRYWLKSDFFNFHTITKLNINESHLETYLDEVSEQSLANFFAAQENERNKKEAINKAKDVSKKFFDEQKEYEFLNKTEIANNNEPQTKPYDYSFFLFKKPLLTLHEAACILTEYDPVYVKQCENDTNFEQNFSNYVAAFDYLASCMEAQKLNNYFSQIDANEFKQFLVSENTFIAGFNDDLQGAEIEKNTDTNNIELQQLKQENEKLKAEIEKLKQAQIQQEPNSEIEAPLLVGLDRINQLAQDRQAMARIMAVYLWEQEEHKDKLPKDIALLVMKEMRNYCADGDIPQTTETMKRIISSVTPEHAKNKRGRPPKKTMP